MGTSAFPTMIRNEFLMIIRNESHESGKLKPADDLRRKRQCRINSTTGSIRKALIAGAQK